MSDEHTRRLEQAHAALRQLRARVESLQAAQHEPVAIIGIGCRLPGDITGPDALWRALNGRVDAIVEVPPDRWDLADWYDPTPGAPGKMNTRSGGFLRDVRGFDPAFFAIAPREAQYMDPQQRLALEVAYEAFEHAGVPLGELAGSQTGVFLGVSMQEYVRLVADQLGHEPSVGTGCANSIAANRISYTFDLRGPSLAVDTACSSSLVAIHTAITSLRARDCDLALAGGVNLTLLPETTCQIARARMLASDGRCKAFDARADGFVRSEGCGLLVLRRLRDAVAAGDRIHAVLRGSAVNQDGRSAGLTAPSIAAQEAVLRRALADAQLSPERVGFVEAHGTGTALGDPVEMDSLKAVYGPPRPDRSPCLVGAVKTNLGHLESAAGVAGLIKAALVLRHRSFVPNLHFTAANPNISLADTCLQLADAVAPWTGPAPRYAAVSSFGMGGTNAHVVLGEAPEPAPSDMSIETAPGLLCVSGHTPAALRAQARNLREHLASAPADVLADLPWTANARRSHHAHRLVLIGDAATLRPRLDAWLTAASLPDGAEGRVRAAHRRRLVFVCSGQGAATLRLCPQLGAREPVFRAAIAECDAAFAALGEPTTVHEADPRDALAVHRVIFTTQVALAALLAHHGVRPDAVVGHSLGELAAAHIAGALELGDAVRVLQLRARLLASAPAGACLVVHLGAAPTRAHLHDCDLDLAIAGHNSPRQTLVSGPPAAIDRLAAALARDGIEHRRTPIPMAAHHPAMDPLAQRMQAALATLRPRPTRLPLYSTVTGERVPGETLDAAYWARNLRAPVRLDLAVAALADADYGAFVELAPDPVLTRPLRDCLAARDHDGVVLRSLTHREPGELAHLRLLAELHCLGVPLRWTALHARRPPPVALPCYAWQRTPRWPARVTPPPARLDELNPDKLDPREADEPASGEPAPAPTLAALLGLFADLLGLTPDALDPHADLHTLGLDSITLVDGLRRLEARHDRRLSLADLSVRPLTLAVLAARLSDAAPAPSTPSATPTISASAARLAPDWPANLGLGPAVSSAPLQLADGGTLELLVAGAGPPLLLLLPLDATAGAYAEQVAALASSHRLLIPHYPGFGRSHAAPRSLRDLAAALLDALPGLGVGDRFHALGWSLGGMLAQHLAIQAGPRLASLTLVNTTAHLGQDTTLGDLHDLLHRLVAHLAAVCPDPARRDPLRARFCAGLDGVDLGVRLHHAAAALDFDGRPALADIQAPTLVLAAEDDPLTPPAHARSLAAAIPRARCHVLAAGGHFIPLLAPAELHRALRLHLTAHAP